MKRFRLSLRALLAGSLLLLGSAQEVAAGPAPPLTAEYVIAVASTGYFNATVWDPVPAGAVATTHDHSGPVLYVAVYEQGYAQGQFAFFNGLPMQLYSSQPYPGTPGSVAVGFIRIYYIRAPFTSGTFRCQSTSINVPIRTLSTSLFIR